MFIFVALAATLASLLLTGVGYVIEVRGRYREYGVDHIGQGSKLRIGAHLNDNHIEAVDCNSRKPLCVSDADCASLCINPTALTSCIGSRCTIDPKKLHEKVEAQRFPDCRHSLGCAMVADHTAGLAITRAVHMMPLVNHEGSELNPISFRHASLKRWFDYGKGNAVSNEAIVCDAGFVDKFIQVGQQVIKLCLHPDDPMMLVL